MVTYFNKRTFILYLSYGLNLSDSGLKRIDEISSNLIESSEKIYILIDNKRSNYYSKLDDRTHLISGDNTTLEFSGWDVGYKFIDDNFNLNVNDIIIFANDTFDKRNYSDGGREYLKYFDKKYLEKIIFSNLAIGYMDDFPKTVNLMGIEYKSWIRSNIFVISYDLAKKIYPLSFPIARDYIFGTVQERFFKPNMYISENWMAYISSWLFGHEDPNYPEYRLRWLKFEVLSEENRSFFQKKCLAILSEHYLSARLHYLGANIINLNKFPLRVKRHIEPYYKND